MNLLIQGKANHVTESRGRFPERRRHPADLQSPQQGYPKVLGRSLRVGAGQHRGLSGFGGVWVSFMAYEQMSK
jgi:hypothetical protein